MSTRENIRLIPRAPLFFPPQLCGLSTYIEAPDTLFMGKNLVSHSFFISFLTIYT